MRSEVAGCLFGVGFGSHQRRGQQGGGERQADHDVGGDQPQSAFPVQTGPVQVDEDGEAESNLGHHDGGEGEPLGERNLAIFIAGTNSLLDLSHRLGAWSPAQS